MLALIAPIRIARTSRTTGACSCSSGASVGELFLDGVFGRFEVGHFHVDDRLPGDDAFVEAAIERRLHRRFERHDRLDVVAGDQLGFGDRFDVVRGNHRQLHRAAGDGDRHARPLPGQPLGQQPHDLRIDGLRHDFDERHAELLGQRFAELIHRDQPAAHEDAAEHAALRALRGKRRFELALRDVAAPNQDVAKSGHVRKVSEVGGQVVGSRGRLPRVKLVLRYRRGQPLDFRFQHDRIVGNHQVFVGTGVVRFLHVFQVAVRGQEHDRNVARPRVVAEAVDELDAVHARQHVVDDDQRRQVVVRAIRAPARPIRT